MSSGQTASVTIVIVAYRSRDTISTSLDALRPGVESGLTACVVVDNASDDGIGDFLAENYPWVEFVPSPVNIGFGRGCNLGFEHVRSPYVLFLNPDAQIAVADLKTMVDFMDAHPDAAIAGPSTTVRENVVQHAGLLLTPRGLVNHSLGIGEVYPESRPIEPGSPAFQTNWICGAAMMVRSDCFRQLGGFDPRFFLYYEETDLCLRARRSGREIWAVGEAWARHVGGASAKKAGGDLTRAGSGDLMNHYFASRFYYLGKNYGWLRAVFADSLSIVTYWGRRFARFLLRRPDKSGIQKRTFIRLPAKPAE